MTKQCRNHNIRFSMGDDAAVQAWERLHSAEVEKDFKSSLACVYGPMMIAEYLPYELQKVLDLLPLVGSGADIFRTNTFHIFGKYVWSPYLLVTVPILVGIFCMPFAVRNWSRRMKV
mgnify:CR=1 FL=1